LIDNVINNSDYTYVSGFQLKFKKNLYLNSYPFSVFNIGYYNLTEIQSVNIVPVRKAICFPSDKNDFDFLIVPYAHM